MAKTIVIVDYGLGNLFSIQNALLSVGAESIVSGKKSDISDADAVILPGMGAFGDAMAQLKNMELVGVLQNFAAGGKPFLGVCLGLQLLMERSEEFGHHEGLGLIPGTVKRFEFTKSNYAKVPQVGWNRITPPSGNPDRWNNTPLKNIPAGTNMYFVHSYYVNPDDEPSILTESNYEGIAYCSGIQKNNIFATQFHPERSGPSGLQIYSNWIKTI